MKYRTWRSAREVVSYQEGDLRCDFTCTYASAGQPQQLYLHDRCKQGEVERRLTDAELLRVEQSLRKYLTERRVLGVKLRIRDLQIIRQQSL